MSKTFQYIAIYPETKKIFRDKGKKVYLENNPQDRNYPISDEKIFRKMLFFYLDEKDPIQINDHEYN